MTITPYPGNANWPANFQGCTLTGQYVGLNGSPMSGTVTLTAAASRLVSASTGVTLVDRPIVVALDANGEFSITIPASDDPDIVPTNFTWTLAESFDGGGGQSYAFVAPQNTTIDVSVITPVSSSGGSVPSTPGVTSVAGRTGTIVLTLADISDAGSAAAQPASAFFSAGSAIASTVMVPTSGTPASGNGLDGDYADDPATGIIYGPKNSANSPAWPAVPFAYRSNRPSNAQSGSTYTLALSDIGKTVRTTNATAATVTVPQNASVAFPIGTVIRLTQAAAGILTIGHSGVTIRSVGSIVATTGQWQQAELHKVGTDEWELAFFS